MDRFLYDNALRREGVKGITDMLFLSFLLKLLTSPLFSNSLSILL